jgi:hypothetical protein
VKILSAEFISSEGSQWSWNSEPLFTLLVYVELINAQFICSNSDVYSYIAREPMSPRAHEPERPESSWARVPESPRAHEPESPWAESPWAESPWAHEPECQRAQEPECLSAQVPESPRAQVPKQCLKKGSLFYIHCASAVITYKPNVVSFSN